MKTYHLFISHSWTYTDEYKNLINLLDQAKNLVITITLSPKMILYMLAQTKSCLRQSTIKCNRAVS